MFFTKLSRIDHRKKCAQDKVAFLRTRLYHRHLDEARRYNDEKSIQLLSIHSTCIYLAGFMAIALFQAKYPLNLESAIMSLYAITASLTVLFSVMAVAFAFLMLLGIYKECEKLTITTFYTNYSTNFHDFKKGSKSEPLDEQKLTWYEFFRPNWKLIKYSFNLGILFFCFASILLAWIATWSISVQAVYGTVYLLVFGIIIFLLINNLLKTSQIFSFYNQDNNYDNNNNNNGGSRVGNNSNSYPYRSVSNDNMNVNIVEMNNINIRI